MDTQPVVLSICPRFWQLRKSLPLFIAYGFFVMVCLNLKKMRCYTVIHWIFTSKEPIGAGKDIFPHLADFLVSEMQRLFHSHSPKPPAGKIPGEKGNGNPQYYCLETMDGSELVSLSMGSCESDTTIFYLHLQRGYSVAVGFAKCLMPFKAIK